MFSFLKVVPLLFTATVPFYLPGSKVYALQLLQFTRSCTLSLLISVILVDECWYLTVGLVPISVLSNDMDHIYMLLFAIQISFLKKRVNIVQNFLYIFK